MRGNGAPSSCSHTVANLSGHCASVAAKSKWLKGRLPLNGDFLAARLNTLTNGGSVLSDIHFDLGLLWLIPSLRLLNC
jgi:hypothetical protein